MVMNTLPAVQKSFHRFTIINIPYRLRRRVEPHWWVWVANKIFVDVENPGSLHHHCTVNRFLSNQEDFISLTESWRMEKWWTSCFGHRVAEKSEIKLN